MPLRNTLLTAFIAVSSLEAAAGDFGDGVQRAARAFRARTASGVPYTRLDHALDSGTKVVGYADAGGNMFAVTWSGPFQPDLQSLLGPHFPAFRRAQERAPGLHSPVVVRSDAVIIVSRGHLGAFEGWAWLPARVPAGFELGSSP